MASGMFYTNVCVCELNWVSGSDWLICTVVMKICSQGRTAINVSLQPDRVTFVIIVSVKLSLGLSQFSFGAATPGVFARL